MSETVDLVERLVEAAWDAVLARRVSLENGGACNLRSIAVEIEPANSGAVLTTKTYLAECQVKRGRG